MFLGSRYSVPGSRYSVRKFNKIKHVEPNGRTEFLANIPRVSVRRFCSTGTKSQPKLICAWSLRSNAKITGIYEKLEKN